MLAFHGIVASDIDTLVTTGFLAFAFGIPLFGYVLMALDIRAYLRSLGRTMVLVARIIPTTPYWSLSQQPPCLIALNLQFPITESEVLAAYRVRVKQLHPDRGGDLQNFLQLQQHFEQALNLARQHTNG